MISACCRPNAGCDSTEVEHMGLEKWEVPEFEVIDVSFEVSMYAYRK
jgi:coenzyme PQQ precursor peptide PqqA